MEKDVTTAAAKRSSPLATPHPVLLGAISGLAMIAGWAVLQKVRRSSSRRYTDHASDRRQPMSLFIPSKDFHRRQIDRSGTHPLFERRQSVYNAY